MRPTEVSLMLTSARLAAGNPILNFTLGLTICLQLDTVPPETIYPLRRGKTSSLPKGPAANSPRWDEFLDLVLDGRDRMPRQARRGISR